MSDAINIQMLKMLKNLSINLIKGNISKYPDTNCKSIVVWGSNLGLTMHSSNYSKLIRNMISLPQYQHSVVIGLLLSDGWLRLSSTNAKNSTFSKLNARLGFGQSFAKFDYFFHVFFIMGHYCASFPIGIKVILNKKVFYSLRFFTRHLPCFTELYDLFYINKIKCIPTDIYHLLDPIALAHWIMGDGSKAGKGLLLCTDSYTISDVILLMNVLTIRYGFICSIHIPKPGQYRIYISSKSKDKLFNVVNSYIVPSMKYKLGI